MSDYGLGYFPIAGPKNSSFSLELCHAVSFCIFCPWGYKSSTGSAQQRIEALLPRHDGQTMIPPHLLNSSIQPNTSSPTRQLTADACRLRWQRRGWTNKTVTMPALAFSPTYQSVWEPAHPDTVLRYGQPDTTFTTKASTLILCSSHFI